MKEEKLEERRIKSRACNLIIHRSKKFVDDPKDLTDQEDKISVENHVMQQQQVGLPCVKLTRMKELKFLQKKKNDKKNIDQ